MPTCPSSSAASASTLRGGKGQSQKRFSTFFSILACSFFGMTLTTYPKKDLVESLYKGYSLKVKIVPFLHFRAFSQKLVSNFFSILA